ncbi:MAG: hypothetical protein MZV63_69385 [Marinilabiliales bacterium]|nr:hypothetical protein [Marinilabiliales bacterium]
MSDYIVDGRRVPVHLVDIVDAGYRYNVYEYQRDFLKVFDEMCQPRLFSCGLRRLGDVCRQYRQRVQADTGAGER